MQYVAGLVSTDTGSARLLIYFEQVGRQSLDDCTIDAAAAIRNWLTEQGIQFEETVVMPHDLTKPNSPALTYRFSAAGESRKWALGYTTAVDDTWNTLVNDWQPDPQHCDMDTWRQYLMSLRVYGFIAHDSEPIGTFKNVPEIGPALPDPLQDVDFQKRIEQIRQLKAQLKERDKNVAP